MNRIMSFDLGSRTGCATLRGDGSVVDCRIIELPDPDPGWRDMSPFRALTWKDTVAALLDNLGPDVVAFEEIRAMRGSGIIIAQAGILLAEATERNVPIFGLNLSKVKKIATGSGNASKDQMLEALSPDDWGLVADRAGILTGDRDRPYTALMLKNRMYDLADAIHVGRALLEVAETS